ncbi:hypothetical protein MMC28_000399 [Mycoblastus sanguinarius]|nr:hypothetical protein [Mycoblastus sanguinarius]
MDDDFLLLEVLNASSYVFPRVVANPAPRFATEGIFKSLKELRATLDVLKESAIAEESAAFDPSGSSVIQDDESTHGSSDRARSWHGDVGSVATEDTEGSDVSQALESLNIGNDGQRGGNRKGVEKAEHDTGLEELSPAEKASLLKEMFPSARDFDISYTLKKAGNNFGKTVEELLNQAFLDEEGLNGGEYNIKKGIEAFTEPTVSARGRRARRKKRQLLRRTSSTPAPLADQTSDSPSPLSRWDRAKEDVDFIAQRTYFSPQAIASIYHKNAASLPSTISALCASTDSASTSNPYLSMATLSVLEAHAADLAPNFPTLPFLQLTALINLTYPSTSSAHELAHALYSMSTPSSTNKIVPQYLLWPSSLNDNSSGNSSDIPCSPNTPLPLASSTATVLATTRSQAFIQAQSAYRKSKSKPLMAGAASYYSSVGRDASASLRRHEAAAADALVTGQSKPGELDLHGVNVKDAVRITRERVESWWEREGREWARAGKVMGRGIRVITGAGHHSAGGRARLGPAVGGMLVKEGWKIEVGEGVVEVVGRVRR